MGKYKLRKWFGKGFSTICQCNIKNDSGNNKVLSNTIDFIALIAYIVLALITVFNGTLNNLSYWIIIILSIRSIAIHLKQIKNEDEGINIVQVVLTAILGFFSILIFGLFFAFNNTPDEWVRIIFSAYYLLYFITELTDILFSLYDAEPYYFKKGGDE